MCPRFHTAILIIQIRIGSGLSQNNRKQLGKLCSGNYCTTGRSKGWRLVCELCAQDAEDVTSDEIPTNVFFTVQLEFRTVSRKLILLIHYKTKYVAK